MENNSITVLMYHALEVEPYDSGYTKKGDRIYVLSAKTFREQIEYLFSEGYKTYLLHELSQIRESPERKIVITFDDGHESNNKIAFPILKEFGFKAEFFVTTNFIGTDRFMDVEQIKLIHRSGMGIGSHGVSHQFLTDLKPVAIEKELVESKKILEQIIGEPVFFFSAPGGRIDTLGINSARKYGYKLVCTSEPKPTSLEEAEFLISRYAIKTSTSFNHFQAIINHQEKWYRKESNKQAILRLCKTILGNKTYGYLRDVILFLVYQKS